VKLRAAHAFAAAAVTATALAVAAGWVFFLLNAPLAISGAVDVDVQRGETPRSIAERLEQSAVVRSADALTFLARMSGLDREIRYGTHRFEGVMTPNQVLDELRRTPQPIIRVTVAEGSTMAEIGAQLETAGIVPAAAYHQAACDPALLTGLGASQQANCAEGYLFPDTYNLAPGMTAAEIVGLQTRRFREVMGELLAARDTADALTGESSDTEGGIGVAAAAAAPAAADDQARARLVADTVILASIVEKEAKVPSERELISSVFRNRLRRGIRLQADPTVIYDLDAAGTPWDRAKLHQHLRNPTPYNTYTRDGLPPGPICNPGREALRAALSPADTKFLYFVAQGDGSHHFAATLADHNRAVAQLRRVARAAAKANAAKPCEGNAPGAASSEAESAGQPSAQAAASQ
jgi:UPF0755 protein